MGIACWVMGKYGEAERWLRAARELNRGAMLPHYFLMRLYLSTGRYNEAIEANLAFVEHAPSHLLLSVQGAAYAGNGNREEAVRILRRLEYLSQSEYVDPLAMAIVQVGLQDSNGAFASLRRALDERPPMAAFLNVDPSFAPLRRDQRFGAVRSTLRLG